MKIVRQLSTYIILAGFAVVLTGCGGGSVLKTEYVEGTVTYKDAPLTEASIAFSPVDASKGTPAYGRTDAQGKYKLQTQLGAVNKGTTPGEYVVIISKSENVPTGKQEKDSDGNMVDITETKTLVPTIYGSATKSPLRATVVKGKNTFDFTLEGK